MSVESDDARLTQLEAQQAETQRILLDVLARIDRLAAANEDGIKRGVEFMDLPPPYRHRGPRKPVGE